MHCQPNYQSFRFSFFRNTWEEFEERLRHRERAEAALNKQYCGNLRVTWWNFAVLFCAFCCDLCSHLYVWFFNPKTPWNQCQLFLLEITWRHRTWYTSYIHVYVMFLRYEFHIIHYMMQCYRSYLVTTLSHPIWGEICNSQGAWLRFCRWAFRRAFGSTVSWFLIHLEPWKEGPRFVVEGMTFFPL